MDDGRGLEEIIKIAWDSAYTGLKMFQVHHKLKECKKKHGDWSRLSFGNIKKQIDDLKFKLNQAEMLALQGDCHEKLNNLRRSLNSLLEKEEKMW